MSQYDITIIGSGPGGYVCAIRCAQLGMKVAMVEKYATLGGTCLNVGCIPSKALLDSSEHYHNASHSFEKHGIGVGKLSLDFKQMIDRKQGVVDQLTGGVDFLMKKNKIDTFQGIGSFKDKNTVIVTDDKGKTQAISTAKVVIATGSKPSTLPFIKIDKKRVITSTEALALKEVPKHLIVIGGGVIGLELGSVYARLGAQVSVVEYADSIIPTMDKDCSKDLTRMLKKEGMKFYLSSGVKEVTAKGNKVTVKADNKKGEEVVLEGDYCLVSVGRKPYTDGLGLDKVGVELDERSRVKTNNKLQTNVENIYAIGDVVAGPMLAHKAEEDGVFLAETLAGQLPALHYDLIPGIVYTWPEVAAVGKTEQELKAEGRAIKVGKFSMKASGRSIASMDNDGFVKVIADAETDEVLGVHMVCARAADLIMEAATAMEFKATAEDIGRICHGHPTFSEALKEAALGAWDQAIHG
jgi:dihydrolipoamide dehydrogenase